MHDRLARVASRLELSEFVRACRERISPEHLGLPAPKRRRAKGLRREEVAALAGVGLTWYTWFEQGRDIHVSDDFLNRFSRGLKLDRAEREHLFALAGRSPLASEADGQPMPEGLLRMIHALPQAAYIMDRNWDVMAFNHAAAELFEDLSRPRPNMLRIVLFSAVYRAKVHDWPAVARLVFLKARHDCLTGGGGLALKRLIDDIIGAIPQAQAWWNDPEILRIGDTRIELKDAERGWTGYNLSILTYEDRPSLRAVVFNSDGDGRPGKPAVGASRRRRRSSTETL